MRNVTALLGLGCVALAILALYQEGAQGLLEGLLSGLYMFLGLVPLLLLAFASAGLISVLISEKQVSRWLGEDSGWKGLLLGGAAGALVPGGPFIFFPIAATLLVSGAQIGTVVCFVTAKNLWTVTRLPVEIALLGIELTFVRYAITLVFPLVAGLAANIFFSRYTPGIRSEILRLQGREKPKAGDLE